MSLTGTDPQDQSHTAPANNCTVAGPGVLFPPCAHDASAASCWGSACKRLGRRENAVKDPTRETSHRFIEQHACFWCSMTTCLLALEGVEVLTHQRYKCPEREVLDASLAPIMLAGEIDTEQYNAFR